MSTLVALHEIGRRSCNRDLSWVQPHLRRTILSPTFPPVAAELSFLLMEEQIIHSQLEKDFYCHNFLIRIPTVYIQNRIFLASLSSFHWKSPSFLKNFDRFNFISQDLHRRVEYPSRPDQMVSKTTGYGNLDACFCLFFFPLKIWTFSWIFSIWPDTLRKMNLGVCWAVLNLMNFHFRLWFCRIWAIVLTRNWCLTM